MILKTVANIHREWLQGYYYLHACIKKALQV